MCMRNVLHQEVNLEFLWEGQIGINSGSRANNHQGARESQNVEASRKDSRRTRRWTNLVSTFIQHWFSLVCQLALGESRITGIKDTLMSVFPFLPFRLPAVYPRSSPETRQKITSVNTVHSKYKSSHQPFVINPPFCEIRIFFTYLKFWVNIPIKSRGA